MNTIRPTCFKSNVRTPLGPVVAKKLKVKPVSQKGTQSEQCTSLFIINIISQNAQLKYEMNHVMVAKVKEH